MPALTIGSAVLVGLAVALIVVCLGLAVAAWHCIRLLRGVRTTERHLQALYDTISVNALAAAREDSEASLHDPLTGLPNRAALMQRAAIVLAAAAGTGRWSAMLQLDVDEFKILNDTKGHLFGDRLLVAIAERLKPAVGNDAYIARLSGDEFVVLLPDVGATDSAAELQSRRIAGTLQGVIRNPFILDGFTCHVTVTIGVALAARGANRADELLKHADMAMFSAKAAARGTVATFVPAMQLALEEQLALTMDLRQALEEGALFLAYQPQIDDQGECFGVEALLRWNTPARGLVPPAVFIPLAERAGLAGQIDAFVLSEACATLRRWRDDPLLGQIRLSVNIGSRRLDRGLVTLVEEAVRAHGVDANRLTIEITERVMFDNLAEVAFAMSALKNEGVQIALDDFGTGYSSLSHLKRLPIDALKIDRSFIEHLETDGNDRVIVQTIANIARNLGVVAIAEGVETEMQALLLKRVGCHIYQGYLYGKPSTLVEFEAWARAPERNRPGVVERRAAALRVVRTSS